MWIVAVAWIYVVVLMAATEPTVTGGIMTFLAYCVVPLSILFYLTGSKRRRAKRELQARKAAKTGEATRAAFQAYPGREGKYLADMFALARMMLARDGVARVHGGTLCTATAPERFYSYRRDGVTGRQASLIWLK